jgi:hypothetical protein
MSIYPPYYLEHPVMACNAFLLQGNGLGRTYIFYECMGQYTYG